MAFKPMYCPLCWMLHVVADGCDPVERAAAQDCRRGFMAEIIADIRSRPRLPKVVPFRRPTDDEFDDDIARQDDYGLQS